MGESDSGVQEEPEEQSRVVPVPVVTKRVFAGGEWVPENLTKFAEEDDRRRKLERQRQAEYAAAVQRGQERIQVKEVHKQAEEEQRRQGQRHKDKDCSICGKVISSKNLKRHTRACKGRKT